MNIKNSLSMTMQCKKPELSGNKSNGDDVNLLMKHMMCIAKNHLNLYSNHKISSNNHLRIEQRQKMIKRSRQENDKNKQKLKINKEIEHEAQILIKRKSKIEENEIIKQMQQVDGIFNKLKSKFDKERETEKNKKFNLIHQEIDTLYSEKLTNLKKYKQCQDEHEKCLHLQITKQHELQKRKHDILKLNKEEMSKLSSIKHEKNNNIAKNHYNKTILNKNFIKWRRFAKINVIKNKIKSKKNMNMLQIEKCFNKPKKEVVAKREKFNKKPKQKVEKIQNIIKKQKMKIDMKLSGIKILNPAIQSFEPTSTENEVENITSKIENGPIFTIIITKESDRIKNINKIETISNIENKKPCKNHKLPFNLPVKSIVRKHIAKTDKRHLQFLKNMNEKAKLRRKNFSKIKQETIIKRLEKKQIILKKEQYEQILEIERRKNYVSPLKQYLINTEQEKLMRKKAIQKYKQQIDTAKSLHIKFLIRRSLKIWKNFVLYKKQQYIKFHQIYLLNIQLKYFYMWKRNIRCNVQNKSILAKCHYERSIKVKFLGAFKKNVHLQSNYFNELTNVHNYYLTKKCFKIMKSFTKVEIEKNDIKMIIAVNFWKRNLTNDCFKIWKTFGSRLKDAQKRQERKNIFRLKANKILQLCKIINK
ncbi:hypothetical protein A3Q56_05547 [Intoshia linei]|uniref:Sfi1 spindle body domain-containing protein n=1 Tax=Intoshia linei TaxID=1819745 RepID=A0A177AZ33_9BILA|nr:hypothetical protein A3Q56_05547 [Intoshia linei]